MSDPSSRTSKRLRLIRVVRDPDRLLRRLRAGNNMQLTDDALPASWPDNGSDHDDAHDWPKPVPARRRQSVLTPNMSMAPNARGPMVRAGQLELLPESNALIAPMTPEERLATWVERVAVIFGDLPDAVPGADVRFGADPRSNYMATLERFITFWAVLGGATGSTGLLVPHAGSTLVEQMEAQMAALLHTNAQLLSFVYRANLAGPEMPNTNDLLSVPETVQFIYDLFSDLMGVDQTVDVDGSGGATTDNDDAKSTASSSLPSVSLVQDLFIRYAWRTMQASHHRRSSSSSSSTSSSWLAHLLPSNAIGNADDNGQQSIAMVLRELILHDQLFRRHRLFRGAVLIEAAARRQRAMRGLPLSISSAPSTRTASPSRASADGDATPPPLPKRRESADKNRALGINDFICRYMPKDGNCQFHAIADQLNLAQDRLEQLYDGTGVRGDISDWLSTHGPVLYLPEDRTVDLREYVYLPRWSAEGEPEDPNDRWGEYLAAISGNAWGDNLTLQAAAQIYQRPIVIMDWSGIVSVIKPWAWKVDSKPSAGKKRQPLYLCYYIEYHYDSLELKRSRQAAVAADAAIEEAEE
ncbi:hypothetical protein GGF31_001410 [Allomyces arbusculus]|nr:hypothetical protein GGF31_001410 [Allomyces arbusculus]